MDEVCSSVRDGTHDTPKPVAEGKPLITSKHIKSGQVDTSDAYMISPSDFEAINKRSEVHQWDVLVSMIGTVGEIAVVSEQPQFAIKNVGLLKIGQPTLARWICHYLKSPSGQAAIRTYLSGTSQPFISLGSLRRLPVIMPPKGERQKIAAILTAYDDLIENNSQRIALLEKMAEEIYREWFVRLRFPGHEHTPVHKGVPEGWEFRRLDSFGKVITGKTPPTSNPRNYGGDIPFIKTPDMHGNSFIYATEETLTEDGLNSQPSQILPANSLCVSCIGTGGVVSFTTSRCSTNQQINSICLTKELDLEWLFFTLRSLKGTILAYGATGATMTNLSKGKFSGLKPPVPPPELREKFHNLVEPVFTQTKLLVQANQQLTESRDLLLNRLISGKLRVDDLDIQFPPSMQEEAA